MTNREWESLRQQLQSNMAAALGMKVAENRKNSSRSRKNRLQDERRATKTPLAVSAHVGKSDPQPNLFQ